MTSRIGRNTFLNMAGQAIPIVVALFSIPVTIHYLGDTGFGILTIAWLIIGSSTIFDLGMGRATTKFVAEAFAQKMVEKIPSILGCAVSVQLVLGVVGGSIVAVLAPFLVDSVFTIPAEYIDDTQYVLILAGISIPIVLVTSSYRGLLEAAHRFEIVNILRAIFSSLTYLSPLLGIFFGWGLVGIITLLLGFRVLQFVSTYMVCVCLFPSISKVPVLDRKLFKQMFGFGGWVALSNILSPLQENMERLILIGLMPVAMLTYYSVPKDMLDRIYILPGSLATALFPVMAAMAVTKKEEILDLLLRSTKAITMSVGLVLFVVVVLSEPLLTLWISKEFSDSSAIVLQVLALGVLASSLNLLAMTLLQGIGRPDITAKQQIIRFPIIAFLAWLLISKYGLAGAAAAWTFGRVLALVMNYWAMNRILGWRLKESLSKQVLLSMFVFPGLASIHFFIITFSGTKSLTMEVLLTIIGGLLFILVFWFCVFSCEDRCWARTIMKKFSTNTGSKKCLNSH